MGLRNKQQAVYETSKSSFLHLVSLCLAVRSVHEELLLIVIISHLRYASSLGYRYSCHNCIIFRTQVSPRAVTQHNHADVIARYGKQHMLWYISVCSVIGGLSVSCTQGLGSAIVATAMGHNQVRNFYLVCILINSCHHM